VGTGKFIGNGFPGIVFQRPADGSVEVLVLSGNSSVGGEVVANQGFGPLWTVRAVADLNGDGNSDLVYRNTSTGQVEVQFLDNFGNAIGGGPFSADPFGADFNLVGAGDVNGDGRADLVFQRPSDGLTEVMLVNGQTEIGGGPIAGSPFVDPSWQVVAVNDFNGDGKADLVYRNSNSGIVEIQFLNGVTPIGGGIVSPNGFGTDWNVAGAGDFNGDGHTDLVFHRASDGLTEIMFLNGTTEIGGGLIQNSPFNGDPTWQVVGVGDFNRDGKADIVYRNSVTGVTEIQFLNGTTAIGGGVITFPS
jgi:hypothetical protein